MKLNFKILLYLLHFIKGFKNVNDKYLEFDTIINEVIEKNEENVSKYNSYIDEDLITKTADLIKRRKKNIKKIEYEINIVKKQSIVFDHEISWRRVAME